MVDTFNSHLRDRHLEMGKKVLTKHRIYLDQKFWIKLREAKKSTPEEKADLDLLRIMDNLIKKGRIICPASHIIIDETLRIRRGETQLQQAELIDAYSGGITIQPSAILNQLELITFWRQMSTSSEKLYPRERLAWTAVPFYLGVRMPYWQSLSEKNNAMLQIRFYDYLCQMSLVQVLNMLIAEKKQAPQWDGIEHAKQAASNEKEFENEFSTFAQVYDSEVAGVIDALREDLTNALEYLLRPHLHSSDALTKTRQLRIAVVQFQDYLSHLFSNNGLSTDIPAIHILASLSAIKRYKAKYHGGAYARKGDIRDALHARLALPYFNAFFTEAGLGRMLTDPLLRMNEQYSCEIMWETEPIIEYLERQA